MTREEIIDFCDMKAQLEPENEDIFKAIIKALEQESKKGHWVFDYISASGHKTYHCSECGCYIQPKYSERLSDYKWCSLCGTKMEVEDATTN